MGYFANLFRRRRDVLPCERNEDCPYDYAKEPDRDVEGMPFAEGDPRSCPHYGHVCPEFMEEFGLTVRELNIRATIHCGGAVDYLVETGKLDPDSPQCKVLKKRHEEVTTQYPMDRYPQYY